MESKTIDVQTFISNIERQLDKAAPGQLDTQTRFRDLPDWTSLQALIVVASFEWDYGVTISADEFLEADTLQGLYETVIQKMSQ
jgi:acyl carrier protein